MNEEGSGWIGRSRGFGPRHDPDDAALGFGDRVVRARAVRLQNELETRRFLADEVYRVPDMWLDEVVRVRLADLDRPEV